MRKSLFSLAPAALLLMSVAGTSQAASNAMVTITGNVMSTTCDVRASTTALDLGNHKPADFTAAKTPVTGSTKNFSLMLENCEAAAATGVAGLRVVGATVGADRDVFNEDATSNAGVVLQSVGSTDFIKDGDKLVLKDFSAETPPVPGADDLNGLSIGIQASLVKTTATAPTVGSSIKAPIIFQFDYM